MYIKYIYIWKNLCTDFLNKHRKKSLKNIPLYINFQTFENQWKYLLYISSLLENSYMSLKSSLKKSSFVKLFKNLYIQENRISCIIIQENKNEK